MPEATNDRPGATAWDADRSIVRFPDPAIEIVDERFRSLVVEHEVVERLWTGGRWLEGPVWFGDGRYLLFSDIPNDRMLRWSEATGEVTPYRVPSNNSNGNTRDRQGRLVTCEHLTRRVTRTEHDGRITVLMDGYDGKRLNAPNDVVVHSDGSVWFTDPGYGILGNYEGDRGRSRSSRGTSTGWTPSPARAPPWSRAWTGPTGCASHPMSPFSMSWTSTTSGSSTSRAARRSTDGSSSTRPRASPTASAATATATCGRRPVAGERGSTASAATAPRATLLGQIHLPETTANFCFGGLKKNRLFITASRSLYSVYVEALGDQRP